MVYGNRNLCHSKNNVHTNFIAGNELLTIGMRATAVGERILIYFSGVLTVSR